MTVLVTGAAGFIGFHVARALAARGEGVLGIDDLNDYYDPRLKRDRLAELERSLLAPDHPHPSGASRLPPSPDGRGKGPAGAAGGKGEGEPDGRIGAALGAFRFVRCDFADEAALETATAGVEIDRIVHLGAQAGVRYSLQNPRAYVRSNLAGHVNVLELARARGVKHLVYASSSSVYGGNTAMPFRVEDRVDHPVSLYAATKKADELMSETYAHLFRIPQTGLRFFTVYGEWGRPDMALWLFTSAILEGRPIAVFNHGKMRRDFTYIDDIVAGVLAALDHPPADDGAAKAGGSVSPHALYNIGNNRPEELGRLIDLLEEACGREAVRDLQPIQPGDVPATYADISAIARDLGYAPTTPIEVGVPRFVAWYRGYAGR